ncbi:DNA polymerase III subunit gamma and tau [Luteipulveratus mongoliensis]|uniref:DNA polymerase III subunit gamma/tau n=1 Tax=Luteipulveratus mongoliensis TaxID=571913 RepID=A0A0K1JNK1_9MICO|nr:DNA polymerase III subunit gamma and tau [Luteipulveratus mongoliensis]AKU18173.1 DNA polymerase III subunit gamma/tau [Luteipulveratus mongoliensis]
MTTALYRRYRPETYADVIGQEHVTEPLMQALRTGRVNHAYLFSGPRGCGKTTSARILARCLNCEQGPTPTPCGECQSCVALARGGSGTVDVIEIDAASHGGVDDARDLRERASYGPAQSRYKIYIIDEAHMVTPQGFNALLKIVEEPPEHVKFVFATTEPDKVIGTIRSRTHHYPFRLVPPGLLSDYMQKLCDAEGVTVEPGVLSFVTRAGGGSVRDSLSVLDQLIAGSGDEGLTYAGAAALLGFTDGELLDATVDALAAGDSASAFKQVDKVIESGHDPRRFVEDLLERLRDLIIVAAVPDGAAQVLRSVPEDQLERMRQQASAFGSGALSRAADVVNTGLTEMTGATGPRLQLELICARVLLPGAAGEQGYAARLDRLEHRLEMGHLPTAGDGVRPPPSPAPAPAAEPRPATPPPSAPAAEPAPAEPAAAEPAPAGSPAKPDRQDRHAKPAGETSPEPASAPAASTAPAPTPAASEPAAPAAGARGGIDTAAIRREWPRVLENVSKIKRVTWALISQHAQVLDYDGERLLLGTSTSALAETFRRGQHPDVVRQALNEAIGVDARVEAQPHEGGAPPEVPPTPAGTPDGTPAPEPAADGGWPAESAPEPPDEPPPPESSRGSAPRGDRPRNAAESPRAGGSGTGAAGQQSGPDAASLGAPATPRGGWDAAPGDSWGAPSAPPPAWASAPATTNETPSTSAPAAPGANRSTPSPRQRAMEAARASSAKAGAAEPAAPAADDSAADRDDENIEDSGGIGVPVIQSVLGGTVIDEQQG